MQRGREETPNPKQVADDLEPYRRLIELQKQLVEMAEQNEQTKRECTALREQVARELLDADPRKTGVHRRLRQSAARWLRRLSRRAPNPAPPTPPLDPNNQTFPC